MPSFTEQIKVNGQGMDVHVAVPQTDGPSPAIIVCQHAGGVNRFIKEMCDKLAAEGYVAVSSNLFHRAPPGQVTDRFNNRRFWNDDHVMADMNATVDWLRERRDVMPDRIGVTGFCAGGRVAWLTAAIRPDAIACLVPFYPGSLSARWGEPTRTPFQMAANLNCPMQFHFGGRDDNPSPADMERLDAELTRLGKPHEFHVYPEAAHGFMDFTDPRYVPSVAEAAWPRALAFFAKRLKRAPVAAR